MQSLILCHFFDGGVSEFKFIVVLHPVVIYKFVKIFQNLVGALFTHVPFTTDVYSHKL